MTKEEILKKHFIPTVCSDTYFDHCLERKGEFLSNVTQGMLAMQEYADLQTASLRDKLIEQVGIKQALEVSVSDHLDHIHSLEQRVRELEEGLSNAINGEMDSTKYERLQSLLTSPQG